MLEIDKKVPDTFIKRARAERIPATVETSPPSCSFFADIAASEIKVTDTFSFKGAAGEEPATVNPPLPDTTTPLFEIDLPRSAARIALAAVRGPRPSPPFAPRFLLIVVRREPRDTGALDKRLEAEAFASVRDLGPRVVDTVSRVDSFFAVFEVKPDSVCCVFPRSCDRAISVRNVNNVSDTNVIEIGVKNNHKTPPVVIEKAWRLTNTKLATKPSELIRFRLN